MRPAALSKLIRPTALSEPRAPAFLGTTRIVPTPPSLKRWLTVSALYLVVYRVLFAGSVWLRAEDHFSLWFPPAGLDVALISIFGPWFIPTIIANQLFVMAGWFATTEVLVALGLGWTVLYVLGQGLVYGGMIGVLQLAFGMNARLRSLRDVTLFLLAGTIIAPLLLALWKMPILVHRGFIEAELLWPQVGAYVVGDGTGIALLVPVLAVALRAFPRLWWDHPLRGSEGYGRIFEPKLLAEAAAVVLVALGMGWIIFHGQEPASLEFSYLLFLPVIWIATRYGSEGAALAALAVNTVAAIIIAPADLGEVNPYSLQLGMYSVTAIGLLLGAYVSQRRYTLRRLQRALGEVERAQRLRSAMIVNLSHEVRTPLTIIQGAAEVIGTTADADQREFIGMLRTGTTRLVKTVGRLTDYVLLHDRALGAETQPLELSAFARVLAERYADTAGSKGLALTVVLPGAPVHVEANHDLLMRAAEQLLDNALAYADTITIEVTCDEEFGLLRVQDKGPGMDADALVEAFHAFSGDLPSGTRRYEGLGIGLPLARGLVEAQHGALRAESTAGVGSTFTLALPLAVAHA